jgi:hypothetical protein
MNRQHTADTPRIYVASLADYNAGRLPVRPAKPDFRVEIRAEKKLKRMACYSHASQMRFTSVGTVTKFFLTFNHEYFARGPQK